MTCGIADGEKHRLVLGAGAGKGSFAPAMPVNRIVAMLEEIGAGFLGQEVHGRNVEFWLGRAKPSVDSDAQ
jgi:hypothetical protein